jgi:hypothetical protein
MGTIVGVVAAALTGLVLAGVGSFTAIQLGQSTPSSQITANVISYGSR